ncbi:MAG: HEPN domain-containing protein [Bryobacteraceae bacterium]
MNRSEFQILAIERLEDAGALLKSGRYACAYYICGYAIECALKACIAQRTRKGDFSPRNTQMHYSHDLTRLLELADLSAAHKQEADTDSTFRQNWAIVKDWTEEARYRSIAPGQAGRMLAAVGDPDHGVLRWLRRNW